MFESVLKMSLSKPPRAVIADDERLMRDQLRTRLQHVWPELEVVAEAKNGLEAVQAVREHLPDVIFLDIRMPGLTGIEAAKEIAQLDLGDEAELPEMVFITAYDQYAIDAFEQGVVDYVLKPAEPERLKLTADRLKIRLMQRANDLSGHVMGDTRDEAKVPTITMPLHPILFSNCCICLLRNCQDVLRTTYLGFKLRWVKPFRWCLSKMCFIV